eukprot:jgi/Chrzof1/1879/Cz10g24200.t1
MVVNKEADNHKPSALSDSAVQAAVDALTAAQAIFEEQQQTVGYWQERLDECKQERLSLQAGLELAEAFCEHFRASAKRKRPELTAVAAHFISLEVEVARQARSLQDAHAEVEAAATAHRELLDKAAKAMDHGRKRDRSRSVERSRHKTHRSSPEPRNHRHQQDHNVATEANGSARSHRAASRSPLRSASSRSRSPARLPDHRSGKSRPDQHRRRSVSRSKSRSRSRGRHVSSSRSPERSKRRSNVSRSPSRSRSPGRRRSSRRSRSPGFRRAQSPGLRHGRQQNPSFNQHGSGPQQRRPYPGAPPLYRGPNWRPPSPIRYRPRPGQGRRSPSPSRRDSNRGRHRSLSPEHAFKDRKPAGRSSKSPSPARQTRQQSTERSMSATAGLPANGSASPAAKPAKGRHTPSPDASPARGRPSARAVSPQSRSPAAHRSPSPKMKGQGRQTRQQETAVENDAHGTPTHDQEQPARPIDRSQSQSPVRRPPPARSASRSVSRSKSRSVPRDAARCTSPQNGNKAGADNMGGRDVARSKSPVRSRSPPSGARARPGEPSRQNAAAGPQPARSLQDLVVKRDTQILFEDALRTLCERKQLPVAISALNDIMRELDRSWQVHRRTGGTFSQLCKWFEMRGDRLLSVVTRGSIVTIK